jgi:hypothetical protein
MTAMPLCAKSVRIRGAVGGTWEAPLTVRIGSGPYTPAAKRRLNAPDAYGLARPGGGIVPANAIPASPSQWQFAHVVDGSFLSDPVDVATTPVVVAFDAVKRMRVIDVAVAADVEDGAIVDAGMLTLEPTASLAVELEPPLTDLPMVFFLGVVNAGVDERRRPAILRQLSVLDQVAPRTFDLLAMGDVGVLPASGRTMLEALPPLDSLRIAVSSDAAGVLVIRDLVPASGAAVRIGRGELTPKKLALRRIAGTVTDGADRPVRNATVVVSDFPSRREALTDGNGRFVVPAVLTGPRAQFYVDARGAAPHQNAATLLRDVPVDSGDVFLHLAAEAAEPVADGLIPPPNGLQPCVSDTSYPAIGGVRDLDTDEENFGSIAVVGQNASTPSVDVAVKRGGRWLFIWAVDAFQVVEGTETFPSGGGRKTVRMAAPGKSVPRTLQFVGPNGKPASDVTVYFMSPVGGPDPATFLTDSKGTIRLPCVNLPALPIAVDDDPYTFEGTVTLSDKTTTVTLQKAK